MIRVIPSFFVLFIYQAKANDTNKWWHKFRVCFEWLWSGREGGGDAGKGGEGWSVSVWGNHLQTHLNSYKQIVIIAGYGEGGIQVPIKYLSLSPIFYFPIYYFKTHNNNFVRSGG
jgi:hypothetical protein